jgi:C4-dicarboxylate-specific signal transduction histidine kinase
LSPRTGYARNRWPIWRAWLAAFAVQPDADAREPFRPAVLRYGVAVLSVAAALVSALLLQRYLQTEPFASSLLCAVLFAAWFGGAGADLLAGALAVLAFIYFAAAPAYSFAVAQTEIPRIVIFAIAVLIVIWLSAAQRAAAASLRRTRDDLQAAVLKLEDLNKTLQREHEALGTAQAELAHVSRVATLGEMSASIAHEVNQPLGAIAANGEAGLRWLARDVPQTEEAIATLRLIISDAKRAGNVVGRIRELARKAEPEIARLDINELVDEAIALVKREMLGHQVTLELQLAPGLPLIRGDRIQLQQVIINLVINAVQAMATVVDHARVVTIRTQKHEAHDVLVAIRDAGIGMAPEALDRLFSPFYTTKPDGMGLGLSICRSIVEAHGGQIWASRNAGPGMTFKFAIAACASGLMPGST